MVSMHARCAAEGSYDILLRYKVRTTIQDLSCVFHSLRFIAARFEPDTFPFRLDFTLPYLGSASLPFPNPWEVPRLCNVFSSLSEGLLSRYAPHQASAPRRPHSRVGG